MNRLLTLRHFCKMSSFGRIIQIGPMSTAVAAEPMTAFSTADGEPRRKSVLPGQPDNMLIVKNNYLTFDFADDFENRGRLRITEYCLNGYKEAQFVLRQNEAEALKTVLENTPTLANSEQMSESEISVDESNSFKVVTKQQHIGPVCEIYHIRGLFKTMEPLKVPFSDIPEFIKLLQKYSSSISNYSNTNEQQEAAQ